MFKHLSSLATRTQNQLRRKTAPISIPMLLAGAMLLAASAAVPAAPSSSNNYIAVYATSAVSKEDVSQVLRWSQRNGVPARDAGIWDDAKNAPARIGRPLTSDLRPPFGTGSPLATLVLTSGSKNTLLDALSVTNGIAHLDVTALRRVHGTNTAVAVQLQFRLCSEALRGIGLALGLAPCPMPLCCMMTPQSENALDRRGTNYCPPCSDRLQKLLHARGAAVTEQQ